MLNTGWVGTSTSTGAFSSVIRSVPLLTGYGPYCAWLNSCLLYWTITVPPFSTYLEQPVVVRAEVRPALVRADAGDDDVVAGQVPRGEFGGINQVNIGTELLDRCRDRVADAHHVADLEAGRNPDVNHLHARLAPARRRGAGGCADTRPLRTR